MKVRLTPLGKVVVLLLISAVMSGFTLTSRPITFANDLIIPNYEPPASYANISSKPGFENTNSAYISLTDMKKSLQEIHLKLYFPPDSAKIKEEYYQSLDIFAHISKIITDNHIRVEGNTANPSNDSDPEFGKILSLERAKAVADYLVKKGIDPEQIVVVGNGSNNPIGDNKTEEGKKLNRRVEIFLKNYDKVVK